MLKDKYSSVTHLDNYFHVLCSERNTILNHPPEFIIIRVKLMDI